MDGKLSINLAGPDTRVSSWNVLQQDSSVHYLVISTMCAWEILKFHIQSLWIHPSSIITVASHEHNDVSNHQRLNCLLNFDKQIVADCHWGQYESSVLLAHCEGNPHVTGGFPAQRASNVESISLSQRHHEVLGMSRMTHIVRPHHSMVNRLKQQYQLLWW